MEERGQFHAPIALPTLDDHWIRDWEDPWAALVAVENNPLRLSGMKPQFLSLLAQSPSLHQLNYAGSALKINDFISKTECSAQDLTQLSTKRPKPISLIEHITGRRMCDARLVTHVRGNTSSVCCKVRRWAEANGLATKTNKILRLEGVVLN